MIVLVLIIVLLIIGGGIYFFSQKNQVTQKDLIQQTTTSNQIDTTSQVQQVSTASIQDCGEVINAPSSDVSQQQKNTAAYACMSQAIVACSQATIVIPFPSDTGKMTFKILGSNGNSCSVSKTVDSPPSKMTCGIPSDFIATTNQFLASKNQSGTIFYGVPLFFVPSSTPISQRPIIKNPQTGETVTVQCTDN